MVVKATGYILAYLGLGHGYFDALEAFAHILYSQKLGDGRVVGSGALREMETNKQNYNLMFVCTSNSSETGDARKDISGSAK